MAADGGAGALGGLLGGNLLGQGLGGPFQQVAAPVGVVPAHQIERFTPEARAKARELLIMHLDEQQRADFNERHYFDVMKGERHYRIICTGSISHNVKLLDEAGKVRYSFCCYPADGGAIPPEDVWLAQKLNIEAAEAEFLLTAVKNEPMPQAPQAVAQMMQDYRAAQHQAQIMQLQMMQNHRLWQEDRNLVPTQAEPSKPARGWCLSRWLRRTR